MMRAAAPVQLGFAVAPIIVIDADIETTSGAVRWIGKVGFQYFKFNLIASIGQGGGADPVFIDD